jgi:FMN phosphatase YigB (HAD superfamily)
MLGSVLNKEKFGKPVIVLDVGGVLVDFDLKPLLSTLSEKRGEKLTAPSLADVDKLFLPAQTGEKSFEDLVPAINASLGVSIASAEWRDLLCSIFTGEVPGMKEMLRELRKDFFLVGLTNTIEAHWTFLLETYEILKLFDGFIVSYIEGLAKPDPAIYQRVVDRFCHGQLPCFHTDDTPEYVEAARKMGWRSEVFRGPSHFKTQVLANAQTLSGA